ncbi:MULTISPECIES: hypothetical protein [unclassified Microbacterium]|uniref:hypothetical protein n=1 Tax=unclassified Microbacterium TaxID=2609290 RepID=UPI0030191ED4
MSAKHQDPEYRRNAATIRKRVASAHRRGEAVPCWRCRRAITTRTPYDVGHVRGPSHALDNLAPEHRHEIPGICPGNRAKGGKVGAQITNARHTPTIPADRVTVWPI